MINKKQVKQPRIKAGDYVLPEIKLIQFGFLMNLVDVCRLGKKHRGMLEKDIKKHEIWNSSVSKVSLLDDENPRVKLTTAEVKKKKSDLIQRRICELRSQLYQF
jgi:hypothetical protein